MAAKKLTKNGKVRTASTAEQEVRLKHDGWVDLKDAPAPAVHADKKK